MLKDHPLTMRRFDTALDGALDAPRSTDVRVVDASPLSATEVVALRHAFYRMSTSDLYRVRAILAERPATVDDVALAMVALAPTLADWIRDQDRFRDVAPLSDFLTTIVRVLLTLYVVAEEYAPPVQVVEVVQKAATGALHEMPIPRRMTCFCDSGKKFHRCHGRSR